MKKVIIAVLVATLVVPMFTLAASGALIQETDYLNTSRLGRALGQFFCYNAHNIPGLSGTFDYTHCVNEGYGQTPPGTSPYPAPVTPVYKGK